MATNIYYKEIDDEIDPEAPKIPVKIDDIFLPKLLLGEEHFVPKEKESDIFDSKRDLSNLFEIGDESNWLPPPSLSGSSERTQIYTAKKKDGFLPYPVIKDVSKKGTLIGEIDQLGVDIPIKERQTFTLPEEYRDRWVFFSVDATILYFEVHNIAVSGGFLRPGTVEFNIKNPAFNTLGEFAVGKTLWIYIHEVTLDDTIPYDPETTDIDLADAYADKGEEAYGWWTPLLYLGSTYLAAAGTASFVFTKLPKMAFDWAVLSSSYVHHGGDRVDLLEGTKEEGATSLTVLISSHGSYFNIGIRIEREEPKPWQLTSTTRK